LTFSLLRRILSALSPSRIARTLLVLALAASIGLHWMLLQSVAWVSMIADFSQKNSLRTAVTMTFDGNHPCPLCLAVKAGENSEKQSDKPDLLKGKDLGCFALNEIFHYLPPCPKGSEPNPTPAPQDTPSVRNSRPPVPPPRLQA